MGGLALNYPEIQEIKRVFDDSKIADDYGLEWNIVQEQLFDSNEKVNIVAVNQKSADSLDYERYERENNDGLRVIAIGGDCLSRGLTLEGLVVSYFYRNSQMYDTLMQMGRWFGYRPGYEKLVRIWMAEDAVSWYAHISQATEALKLEVLRMNRNELTPMEFGYKIQGHPDALIPTARAKMKNAKLDLKKYAEIDVAGHLIECPRLHDNIDVMKTNQDYTEKFIKGLGEERLEKNGDWIFRKVAAEKIADYVQSFKTLEWHYYFDSVALADGIREHNDQWNVCIKNGPQKPDWEITFADGKQEIIGAQKRKSLRTKNGKYSIIKVSGSKVKVGAGGCTLVGVEKDSFEKIKCDWENLPPEFNSKNGKIKNVPDEFILHYLDHPLLIIHYLQLTDEDNNEKPMFDDTECKVLALSLAFPTKQDYKEQKTNKTKQKKIRVYLNTVAQQLADEEGDDILYEDL